MLRIRFTRTGKKSQPSYRLVVAEHTAPIKGKHLEIVGTYLPTRNPKIAMLNKERIAHWVSMGAQPTDSVAALLKKEGMTGMEKFMEPRDKKRKSKAEEEKKA